MASTLGRFTRSGPNASAVRPPMAAARRGSDTRRGCQSARAASAPKWPAQIDGTRARDGTAQCAHRAADHGAGGEGLLRRQPRPRRPSQHRAFHPREHDQLVARRSRPEIAPGPATAASARIGETFRHSPRIVRALQKHAGTPRRHAPHDFDRPACDTHPGHATGLVRGKLVGCPSLPVTEFSSLPRRLPDRDCRRAVTCTAIAQCGTRGKVPGKRLRNASKPLDLGQLSDIPEDFSEQRPNVRCFESCREIQFNVILP